MTRLANYLKRKCYVFENRLIRQELKVLENATNVATEVRNTPIAHLSKVFICDIDLALGWLDLADKQVDKGRLARTRMTYQEHEFAGENVQRYIAQRRIVRLRFVDLGNVVKRDNRITRVLRSRILDIHYRKRLRKLRRNLIYWGLLLGMPAHWNPTLFIRHSMLHS